MKLLLMARLEVEAGDEDDSPVLADGETVTVGPIDPEELVEETDVEWDDAMTLIGTVPLTLLVLDETTPAIDEMATDELLLLLSEDFEDGAELPLDDKLE